MKPPKKNPCGSCPYRQDVPSGIWDASEYERLKGFDLSMPEQPQALFACHQSDGTLCSGWVGCHDMSETLGFRVAAALGHIAPEDVDEVLDYESPVPLFASGAEAAAHGMRDIENPGPRAERTMSKLISQGKAVFERQGREIETDV